MLQPKPPPSQIYVLSRIFFVAHASTMCLRPEHSSESQSNYTTYLNRKPIVHNLLQELLASKRHVSTCIHYLFIYSWTGCRTSECAPHLSVKIFQFQVVKPEILHIQVHTICSQFNFVWSVHCMPDCTKTVNVEISTLQTIGWVAYAECTAARPTPWSSCT